MINIWGHYYQYSALLISLVNCFFDHPEFFKIINIFIHKFYYLVRSNAKKPQLIKQNYVFLSVLLEKLLLEKKINLYYYF